MVKRGEKKPDIHYEGLPTGETTRIKLIRGDGDKNFEVQNCGNDNNFLIYLNTY